MTNPFQEGSKIPQEVLEAVEAAKKNDETGFNKAPAQPKKDEELSSSEKAEQLLHVIAGSEVVRVAAQRRVEQVRTVGFDQIAENMGQKQSAEERAQQRQEITLEQAKLRSETLGYALSAMDRVLEGATKLDQGNPKYAEATRAIQAAHAMARKELHLGEVSTDFDADRLTLEMDPITAIKAAGKPEDLQKPDASPGRAREAAAALRHFSLEILPVAYEISPEIPKDASKLDVVAIEKTVPFLEAREIAQAVNTCMAVAACEMKWSEEAEDLKGPKLEMLRRMENALTPEEMDIISAKFDTVGRGSKVSEKTMSDSYGNNPGRVTPVGI
jgi:hypothetical protein